MTRLSFTELHQIFTDAVIAGVRGQDISNALISSKSYEEFAARLDAHIVIAKAVEK